VSKIDNFPALRELTFSEPIDRRMEARDQPRAKTETLPEK
jgi:hypothetical protein